MIAWTAQITYTAPGTTSRDTAALATALGDRADVAYTAGRLRVQLEIEAPTVKSAADNALRTAAAAVGGALKPSQLRVLPTEDFLDETLNPAELDLIGIREVAEELGVSRQRAAVLAKSAGFPPPVSKPPPVPDPREKPTRVSLVYTRDSVKEFKRRYEATRSRAGGRPKRPATPTTDDPAPEKATNRP